MNDIATLVLDFGQAGSQEECPLLYVEVPQDEVAAGDAVEIRLWGPQSALRGWSLTCFHQSLGPGVPGRLQDTAWTQQLDFAATDHAQLEYPFTAITKVETLTPLVSIDPDAPCPPRLWAAKGRDVARMCGRKGYSCLRIDGNTPLHGSVLATVERVVTYRSWFWTVPENTWGDVWFFLYSDTTRPPYQSFALALPELASVAEGLRNLTIRTVDFATEAPVSGAAIHIAGLYRGVTDAEGLLHVADVPTGVHSFKAVREGYLDSDVDGLSNEQIVVR